MTAHQDDQNRLSDETYKVVILGKVVGVFGVQGWLKVVSETEPKDGILHYCPWMLQIRGETHSYRLLTGQVHGKGLIVSLEGCDNRNQAAALVGCNIAVHRSQLPTLSTDDFYWADLEGLEVHTKTGLYLGKISHLFNTGANDVLVINGERERLIPYLWGQVIQKVDLNLRLVIVDWDPSF